MIQKNMFTDGLKWAMQRLHNPNYRHVGLYGEQLVYEVLSQKGFEVVTPKQGTKCGDLRVVNTETGEVLAIEVKTSRRGKKGWQWTLWSRKGQNHRYSDIVILLAVTVVGFPVAFVIPTKHIRDLHSIKIVSHPSDYSGKYARYRQSLRNLSLAVL